MNGLMSIKPPRKNKQWAEEAFATLHSAIEIFREEYPSPTEEEKLNLISFAIPLAAVNRDVSNQQTLQKISTEVMNNIAQDIEMHNHEEVFPYSICFLLSYLDANVALGFLSEKRADEVMDILSTKFNINIAI